MGKQEARLEREIENFNKYLVPFGSSDVAAAIETALEADHNGQWAAEQIEQWCEETDTQLKDVDPVYVVYETILQEARTDIEKATNKDILNDTNAQVYVYGNYVCTSLDYTTEAQEELKAIMRKVRKRDYTPAMKWLYENANLADV